MPLILRLKYLVLFKPLVVLLVVISITQVSCNMDEKPSNNNILGTWFGGCYEIDEGYYLPARTIFHFDADNIVLINYEGVTSDSLLYDFSDDVLTVGENKFSASKIIKNNVLMYRGNHLIRMRRTDPTRNIPSVQYISNQLADKTWKSKNETISFDIKNGQLNVLDMEKNSFSKYCFSIDSFQKSYFIRKYGNHLNCDGNNQFIEQITSITKNSFKVLRWKGSRFTTTTFKRTSSIDLAEREIEFQVCNTYLDKRHLGYYYKGVSYEGGIYKIDKICSSKYKSPKQKENGLVRIRFVVNCQGKTGRFEVLELDENYEEREFATDIPEQLLSICRDLDGWTPGYLNGEYMDSYKFLTFKIKDSEIVEIFP